MKGRTKRIVTFIITFIMVGHSLLSIADGGFIGGTISENTTLSPADNPITVFDIVNIPEGVTVTIEPGTILKFMPATYFEVYGNLVARGTALNPINCSLLNQQGVPGEWNGIKFLHCKTILDDEGEFVSGSILEHMVISQAHTGIIVSDSSKLLFRNVTLQNCFSDGIIAESNSELMLNGLTISDMIFGMIVRDSGILTIKNLNVNNCGYGIKVENQSEISLTDSHIFNCSYGISFEASSNSNVSNCDITNCNFGIMFFSDSEGYSEHNLIENNNIINNGNVGLFISQGYSKIRYNVIRNNTIINNNIGLHIGNGQKNDFGYNVITGNHVSDNDFGIKVLQSNDSITYNLIQQNRIGLMMNTASYNHIYRNILIHNSEWALNIDGGSDNNLVEQNNISENKAAVRLSFKEGKPSTENSFKYNSISENEDATFLILSGPQATIENNNIISTKDSTFVNKSEFDVLAQNNYWGTVDTTIIDLIISDKFDFPEFGEVIYKPILDSTNIESPITRPRMAFKRLIDNNVVVSWQQNHESDLAGYKIYTGEDNDFLDVIVNDTSYTIPGILLTEKIGVTAFDNMADGINDRYEGHESNFTYAVAGPYAGGVNSVCSDDNYFTSSATAIDYQSLSWSTDGDGTFANNQTLHTYYVPGNNDKINGKVNLTLRIVTSTGLILSDVLKLSILEYLIVDTGPDASITDAEVFNTSQANAENYMTLTWITSGDGVFENSDSLITNYIPGQNDKLSGFVTLTLRINSGCGVVSDDMKLQIIRSHDISGTAYKAEMPLSGGIILALNKSAELTRAISLTETDVNGKFLLKDIGEGDYYLYLIPDPSIVTEYLPTYYAMRYKWQDAWLLQLRNDVFDVDIRLQPVDLVLPKGEGSISGTFVYDDIPDSDNIIFNQRWFDFSPGGSDNVQNIEPAGNHVVYLMNTSLTKIIGWTLSDLEGHFTFNQLPFGEYRLWGEKAGYSNKVSTIIYITPENKEVTDVTLNVNVKNRIIESTIAEPDIEVFDTYPNPAFEEFCVSARNFPDESSLHFELYNEKGVKVIDRNISRSSANCFGPVNISDLKSGLYFCITTSSRGCRCVNKVTIR